MTQPNSYTPDDLEVIDRALLAVAPTVAAECIRRGPEGVAATTRKIVEALVKERRELRADAIWSASDAVSSGKANLEAQLAAK